MSTSVGYTSAINGSNVAFAILAKNPKNSGGAINGWMPQPTQTVDKRYSEFEQIRFTLKNAWNTTYPSQLKRDNIKKSMVTPFRAVTNSGDLYVVKIFLVVEAAKRSKVDLDFTV